MKIKGYKTDEIPKYNKIVSISRDYRVFLEDGSYFDIKSIKEDVIDDEEIVKMMLKEDNVIKDLLDNFYIIIKINKILDKIGPFSGNKNEKLYKKKRLPNPQERRWAILKYMPEIFETGDFIKLLVDQNYDPISVKNNVYHDFNMLEKLEKIKRIEAGKYRIESREIAKGDKSFKKFKIKGLEYLPEVGKKNKLGSN